MVRFKFCKSPDGFSGFEVKGHAGYACAGSDIVCAAVSSAAYLAANTITDVVGAKADATAREGYMLLTLREQNGEAQLILKGLEAHIKMLASEYPEGIKVIYGGNTNA